jgi:S-formylglutathione hydrolase FrmB
VGPAGRPGLRAERPDGVGVEAGREQHPDLGLLRHRNPGELGGDDVALNVIEGTALQSNLNFRDQYVAAGGKNGVFNFPETGTHSWGYWGAQPQQMKPDLQRVLGASSR